MYKQCKKPESWHIYAVLYFYDINSKEQAHISAARWRLTSSCQNAQKLIHDLGRYDENAF